ncbi:MAG: diaminopimelate decarboxylase [Deltaproteobacteria bacterium]|nr:diaminopimelate decarboxylase [Deltaproteobacteria bacterium]
MHHFQYINDELYCEEVPLRVISDQIGTPAFVYSRSTLERHFRVFGEPFAPVSHLICYSMKSCSNLAILKIFVNMGSGVDIVSGGELYRALRAGVAPSRIVYSGVGKTASEIEAALTADILMFNVESEEELMVLDRQAGSVGKTAKISFRVNPDVDPLTHPYISTGLKKNKFGIQIERSLELYHKAKTLKFIEPIGVDCHIGSQLMELSPFTDALDRLLELVHRLRSEGIDVRYLDIGGGLGIPYSDEEPPLPAEYGRAILKMISGLDVTLILEPGRVLTGNAGVLVTRVLYKKHGFDKEFVIVDAAMNDLIRPSLYKAYHSIWKVDRSAAGPGGTRRIIADVVGPICESGDFFAQSREMDDVQSGELLALMSAGAYGFSMSSNYNSRRRAAEVLVDKDTFSVIRERETYEDLVKGERIPPTIL